MSDQAPLRKQFAIRQTIFNTGDPSDFCYQIFSGKVNIVLDVQGVKRVVATLGPGEVFGEMGIIDSGPRSASAIAAQDTVCIAYAPEDILEQIDKNPQTMSAIMKTLIKRLRDANQAIADGDADTPLTKRIFSRLIG